MNPDETHPASPSRPARFPLALVVVVGALAGALWWADRQAGRRQLADVRAQLSDALRGNTLRDQALDVQDVEAARQRYEDALRADDADRAADAADRLTNAVAVAHFDNLTNGRAGLAALRHLDRAAGLFVTAAVGPVPVSPDELVAELRAALQKVGIEPGRMHPAAAEALKTSPIRDRLLSALDSWHILDTAGDGREKAALLAVLWEVDPNDYRNEVRAAIHAGRIDRVRGLLGEPEAAGQPAGFAVAMSLFAPPADVLRVARTRQPGSLPVLLALAGGDPGTAVRWGQAAVAARPRSGVAWTALGLVQWRAGDADEAVLAFRQAARFDRDLPVPHFALGSIRYRHGDPAGAVRSLAEAVRLAPNLPIAANELAWMMATHPDEKWRNGRRAVELATRACDLTKGKEPAYLETLAAAHAETGDFAKAVELQKRAAPGRTDRLALYERKQPYRESHPVVAPPPRPK